MGYQTIVYGIIEGCQNFPEENRAYADWNKSIILNLPEEDEFPFLVRDMFSITERDKAALNYCYLESGSGGNYKYERLANFQHFRDSEGLLRQPISSWEFVGESEALMSRIFSR